MLRRWWQATKYSLSGLQSAWKGELAFRQEVVLLAILLPFALLFAGEGSDRLWIFSTAMLLLLTELLNSAIEAVVDRVGSDYHPLSKKAKDMASAAVLLSLVVLMAVWSSIFSKILLNS